MTALHGGATVDAVLLQSALGALARDVVVGAGGVCRRSLVDDQVWEQLGGGALEPDDIEALLDEALDADPGALASFADGRVVDVARVAEGVVLTHRLGEAEVATATLDLSPDLAVLALVAKADGGLHAGDGSALRLRERRRRGQGRAGGVRLTTCLEGPPGWLDVFGSGRLVAARACGGFLALEPVDEDDLVAPADLAEGLGELSDLANEGDGFPVPAEELQILAALDRQGWFSVPRPPFGQLAEAAGFELDGHLVGRPGCWERYRAVGDLVASMARHHLSEAEMSLLLDALKAFDAWRSDPDARPPASLVERLRLDWPVAYPVLEELRRKGAGADDLAGFAAALGGVAGAWLASRAAALGGSAEEAERSAGAALAADPAFGPAVAEAAWYASDRGRARDAANLLHRVRYHDDAELRGLRRLASASAPAVGRNEPCPCGSRRKYKVCHLGRSALPEAERVRWLLDKVRQYVIELAPPELLDDVMVGDDSGAVALGLDLLVFDDGWLRRFLAERASLLPNVERRWAEQWLSGHVASVFRLCERQGDGRGELVDARSGVRYTVEPSPVLDDVAPGRLVWTRLVPVDDRWWTTGLARHTALAERSALLEATVPGTPVERRLEALAPQPDRPRLQNTSGDPTVLCTTVLAVDDPVAAAERLDAALERDGDEVAWHTSAATARMAGAVTATFRLDDHARLTIETNSLKRRDAAVSLVSGLLTAADVVEETRVPMARARAAHLAEDLVVAARRSLGLVSDEVDHADDEDEDPLHDSEEVAAALAQMMKAHEERWLDAPVPALGGRSPREAAADEGSRADLVTLLAEIDDRGPGFDAERLRTRLGVSIGLRESHPSD